MKNELLAILSTLPNVASKQMEQKTPCYWSVLHNKLCDIVVYFEVWLLLVLSPVVVYPFAWSGHYFFEKNTPAAFSNPLWAKLCDWIMLKDILIGKIPA